MLKGSFRYISGFTLIEVLISMIILAVGLLGLASLEGLTLRDSQDAYAYCHANLLAYEMGDRIKANKSYWGVQADGSLNVIPVATQGNECNSRGSVCTSFEMAAYDMYYWEESAKRVLPMPNDTNAKIVDIQRSTDVAVAPCIGTDDSALCLTITWARSSRAISPDIKYLLEITP